jgi:hypothetical protein
VGPSTATFVLGIIGAVTGTTGMVMSIMNYLRDRAAALVTMQWDFVGLDANNQPTGPPMGVVSIVNTGRRPLYIKLVYFEVPKQPERNAVVLKKSLTGQKIGEGDAEFVIPISNEVYGFMRTHLATHWKHLRAIAVDNQGHKYKSKCLKNEPSWARPQSEVTI